MRAQAAWVVLASACATAPAWALAPDQVFDKVSPSVWAVRGLDANERPFSFGSGVVIGAGRMITNCHVLAKAKAIQVRRENVSYEARLEHADAERDLCTLTIKGFTAPAVAVRDFNELKVGQRVYAVGNPEKLALTLSEGLVSGLRTEDPRLPPIQTSAAISPGSSGGGLFDAEGNLVGITTLIVVGRARIAQNLNFAIPATWIAEVPERAKAALAARKEGAAPNRPAGTGTAASPALPIPGTAYEYAWTDLKFNRRQNFTVRVGDVNGWSVTEQQSGGGAARTAVVEARDLRFSTLLLEGGQSITEFAPYYAEKAGGAVDATAIAGYPTHAGAAWRIGIQSQSWETVDVPAGSLRALRVEITGDRSDIERGHPATLNAQVSRFTFTAWYAPDAKRYARIRHQQWNAAGAMIADEQVELLSFKAR